MGEDKPVRPGEIVEIRGREYRVMATNHEGKLILNPRLSRESIVEMTYRLQSTEPAQRPAPPQMTSKDAKP